MSGKGPRLMTERDLRGLAPGSVVAVPAGTIVTALARDLAATRGIVLEDREASVVRESGTVAVAADHGGRQLKDALIPVIEGLGFDVADLGTHSDAAVDYPDLAAAAARSVAEGSAQFAVVVDGAGIGSAMAANKIAGARAAFCPDVASALNAREHNFANVLCLGARTEAAPEVVRTFLTTEQGGEERHALRVAKISALEGASHVEAAAEEPCCCRSHCSETLKDGPRAAVAAGADRVALHVRNPKSAGDLAAFIDHTILKAEATDEEIDLLCAEAREFRFASVCVNSCHVARCATALEGSGVVVCTVVGFPLGAASTTAKVAETHAAVADGAREIDMVINVGWLRSGRDDEVRGDVAQVAETAHRGHARLKVILETALLTDEEKARACRLCREAGADYVKTSTGFSRGGATVEDVALMRRAVGTALGVKASGGIHSREEAEALMAAGATRIGASASIAITAG